MNHNNIKVKLEEKLSSMLLIIDNLNIRVQDKLRIVTQYIHSQLLFELKLYDFPLTWVDLCLDLCALF